MTERVASYHRVEQGYRGYPEPGWEVDLGTSGIVFIPESMGEDVAASMLLIDWPVGRLLVDRGLLEALVIDDDCDFDHHGGCQAHLHLSLEPGQLCPQEQLKRLLGINR